MPNRRNPPRKCQQGRSKARAIDCRTPPASESDRSRSPSPELGDRSIPRSNSPRPPVVPPPRVIPPFFVGGDIKSLPNPPQGIPDFDEVEEHLLPYSLEYEMLGKKLRAALDQADRHPGAIWCEDVIKELINQMEHLKEVSDNHLADFWSDRVRDPMDPIDCPNDDPRYDYP